MKTLLRQYLLLTLFFSATVAAVDLDTNFGTSGVLNIQSDIFDGFSQDRPFALKDGGFVVPIVENTNYFNGYFQNTDSTLQFYSSRGVNTQTHTLSFLGDAYREFPFAIAEQNDGTLIVAGYYNNYNSASFYDQNGDGNVDAVNVYRGLFLSKVTGSGEIDSSFGVRTFQESQFDNGNYSFFSNLVLDEANGVALMPVTNISSYSTTLVSIDLNDGTLRYSSMGQSLNYGRSIALDENGDVFVAYRTSNGGYPGIAKFYRDFNNYYYLDSDYFFDGTNVDYTYSSVWIPLGITVTQGEVTGVYATTDNGLVTMTSALDGSSTSSQIALQYEGEFGETLFHGAYFAAACNNSLYVPFRTYDSSSSSVTQDDWIYGVARFSNTGDLLSVFERTPDPNGETLGYIYGASCHGKELYVGNYNEYRQSEIFKVNVGGSVKQLSPTLGYEVEEGGAMTAWLIPLMSLSFLFRRRSKRVVLLMLTMVSAFTQANDLDGGFVPDDKVLNSANTSTTMNANYLEQTHIKYFSSVSGADIPENVTPSGFGIDYYDVDYQGFAGGIGLYYITGDDSDLNGSTSFESLAFNGQFKQYDPILMYDPYGILANSHIFYGGKFGYEIQYVQSSSTPAPIDWELLRFTLLGEIGVHKQINANWDATLSLQYNLPQDFIGTDNETFAEFTAVSQGSGIGFSATTGYFFAEGMGVSLNYESNTHQYLSLSFVFRTE